MRGKEEVGGDAIEELRPSDVRIGPYAIQKVVLRWLTLERERTESTDKFWGLNLGSGGI